MTQRVPLITRLACDWGMGHLHFGYHGLCYLTTDKKNVGIQLCSHYAFQHYYTKDCQEGPWVGAIGFCH